LKKKNKKTMTGGGESENGQIKEYQKKKKDAGGEVQSTSKSRTIKGGGKGGVSGGEKENSQGGEEGGED